MHRKLVGLTAAAFAAAVAVSAAGPGVASAAKVERVSTLGKESFFAYVDKAAIARAKPDAKSKRVAKLTLKTPEKTDDLVFVLERTEVDDKEWLRVRLPVRPNGTTGWVPADALSELQPVNTWLKISTKTFKITLIRDGKRVFSAPIGVGQSQWPTPKGQFYIRGLYKGYGGRGLVLRTARVLHERHVGSAHRLAGRRTRRRARHVAAGTPPGPRLARLRAHEER